MSGFFQDVRHALRSILRHSGFSALVVALLGVGIGMTLAVVTLVDRALLKPLPCRDGHEMVMVWETWLARGLDRAWVSPPNLRDWSEQTSVFTELASQGRVRSFNLAGAGQPQRVEGVSVSDNFFAMYGTEAELGRTFLPGQEDGNEGMVVLSHGLWERTFGAEPEVIDTTFQLDGAPYTVIGVMPRSFELPQRAELWLPLTLERDAWPRTAHFLEAVGRLKPGIELSQAQAEMDVLTKRLAEEYPESNTGWGARVVPLREELVGEIRPALLLLSSAVALLLLITCANAANLLLARTVSRDTELALRIALGAGRGRLSWQLLVESLILTGLAALLGLGLALGGSQFLLKLSPVDLHAYGPRLDIRVFVTTLLVAGFAGLLFGLAPLLRVSRIRLQEALQGEDGGRSTADSSRRRLRSLLVVVNVGLSLALLSSAGILVKSYLRLRSVDPGFATDGVLTVQLSLPKATYPEDSQVTGFYEQALERIRTLPGVDTVGATTALPLTSSTGGTMFLPRSSDELAEGEQPLAQYATVTSGYFDSLGITRLYGRDFDPGQDRAEATPVVVVSASLARKYWPNEDPVGQQIFVGLGRNVWYEIVGVVGEVHEARLDTPPRPMLYLPQTQRASRTLWLTIRTKLGWEALADPVQREVWKLDPHLGFAHFKTMQEWFGDSMARERFLMALLSIFSTVGVLLAIAGIYGVFAYNVAQRAREVGIRMALGASPGTVVRQLVGEGMWLSGLGLGLGLLTSASLARLFTGLLFGVEALDPVTLSLTIVALAFVTLAAVYLPSRKVAQANPRSSLYA